MEVSIWPEREPNPTMPVECWETRVVQNPKVLGKGQKANVSRGLETQSCRSSTLEKNQMKRKHTNISSPAKAYTLNTSTPRKEMKDKSR